jgi:hypothetical protein
MAADRRFLHDDEARALKVRTTRSAAIAAMYSSAW